MHISTRSEYRPISGPTSDAISAEPKMTMGPPTVDISRVTPMRCSTDASITLNEPIRQPTTTLCEMPAITAIQTARGWFSASGELEGTA